MKLGFIGCGNMAKAMIGGVIQGGVLKPEDIIGSTLRPESREKVKETYGIKVTGNNLEVVEHSDMVVLAVKPYLYEKVIGEIRDSLRSDQVIIAIAAGQTIADIERDFDKKVKVVRTMPNTPVLVSEGMTAVCANAQVTAEELDSVCKIFRGFGKVELIGEHLIDAVIATSGSSPAYVYMFIEAMADGAVAEGMPRAQAYKFAAQAVLGSAKMVLETGIHPGELKDMVCSPGGTTIQAVRVLEERGLRSAVIEAMTACAEASRTL
ncbi:MAG: pyrroline-5-carboxylate reductase [Lachnospiraceae bacterium]